MASPASRRSAQFPPNGYGLFDVAGNVWEWVPTGIAPTTTSAGRERVAATHRVLPTGSIPTEPGINKRVQRGGSFLCTDQYCSRYLVGTRGKGDVGRARTTSDSAA